MSSIGSADNKRKMVGFFFLRTLLAKKWSGGCILVIKFVLITIII